jgi:3-isopropylmalate/(R)-2-methylmalate dehydratase small subunit
VVLPAAQHAQLLQMDGQEITVDLQACMVTVRGRHADVDFPFRIDAFARHCLLRGMDRLDYLLSQREAIRQFEANR